MKRILFYIIFSGIQFMSCQKEAIPGKSLNAKDNFRLEAIEFLKAKISRKDFNNLNRVSPQVLETD